MSSFLYYYDNETKGAETEREIIEKRSGYKILVRAPKGRKSLGKPRYTRR
jgi:hypothetical protein